MRRSLRVFAINYNEIVVFNSPHWSLARFGCVIRVRERETDLTLAAAEPLSREKLGFETIFFGL